MKIPADNCINVYLHMSIFAQGDVFKPLLEYSRKKSEGEVEKEQIFKAAFKSYNEKRAAEQLLFIEEVKRKKASSSMFYMDRLD